MAQFRIVVQETRRASTSGRVIANLGFYNPHTKEHAVDLEKVTYYLQNGAQPSSRVVKFLIEEKVDLPKWVKEPAQRQGKIKNVAKLRRHQHLVKSAKPVEPAPEATVEPAADQSAETADESDEVGAEDSQAGEAPAEASTDKGEEAVAKPKEAVDEETTAEAEKQEAETGSDDNQPVAEDSQAEKTPAEASTDAVEVEEKKSST